MSGDQSAATAGVQVARVDVLRDGAVESWHRGHVVVADAGGEALATAGEPERAVYVRSAVKPLQALAVLELLDAAGCELDPPGLAITCASHSGSSDQQIEAARLLALAGRDESDLRCPAALPVDLPALLDQRVPTPLAHNCSGKHAGFLYAQVVAGGDPARYLQPDSLVQRRVHAQLAALAAQPQGPGVDGCGAPAWRLPLRSLAVAFARLAATTSSGQQRVVAALRAHPELVGGATAVDTLLMRADDRVIAKRGAEGVLAAGVVGPRPVGVAVKVEDGGARAAGPLLGTALQGLGCVVPEEVVRPLIAGGGQPHGQVEVEAGSAERLVAAVFEPGGSWGVNL